MLQSVAVGSFSQAMGIRVWNKVDFIPVCVRSQCKSLESIFSARNTMLQCFAVDNQQKRNKQS